MSRAQQAALLGLVLLAGCHVGIHVSTASVNVESSGNDLCVIRGERRVVLVGANGWGSISVQQNDEDFSIRFPDRELTFEWVGDTATIAGKSIAVPRAGTVRIDEHGEVIELIPR